MHFLGTRPQSRLTRCAVRPGSGRTDPRGLACTPESLRSYAASFRIDSISPHVGWRARRNRYERMRRASASTALAPRGLAWTPESLRSSAASFRIDSVSPHVGTAKRIRPSSRCDARRHRDVLRTAPIRTGAQRPQSTSPRNGPGASGGRAGGEASRALARCARRRAGRMPTASRTRWRRGAVGGRRARPRAGRARRDERGPQEQQEQQELRAPSRTTT